MDLKRMQHLVALADERHFGRAAQACHLSQSAFSRSVQAAEEDLGLTLFDRGGKEVRCTTAGRFLIERARKLLFDSRCLDRDIGLFRGREIGELCFGVGPFPAATMLPHVLCELRRDFPGVSTRVIVNGARQLGEQLRDEVLDFAVGDARVFPTGPDLVFSRIGRQTANFYVRAGHPLARRRRLPTQALLQFGLASVQVPDATLRRMAPMLGLSDASELKLALVCDDLNVLKAVTLASDSVLVGHDAAVADELARKTLVRLQLLNPVSLVDDLGIVTLKGRSLSPMGKHAADLLRRVAAGQTG